MNVLSLFDGMSAGQIALERAGIQVDNYFASEIEPAPIAVTQHNYPNTIQLGDIRNVKGEDLPKIDLVIGGSPCQGFSFCGKELNFEHPESKLFFEYVRLLEEVRPTYFLLENVVMQKKFQDEISKCLGVEPILIDSGLLSAQRRKRLYWTNIPNITQPIDKGLVIRDILDPDESKYKFLDPIKVVNPVRKATYLQWDTYGKGHDSQDQRAAYLDHKHWTLAKWFKTKILLDDGRIRKGTQLELERLQTVPEGYTSTVSYNKAGTMLGNGWTVDVIAHIFKGLGDNNE